MIVSLIPYCHPSSIISTEFLNVLYKNMKKGHSFYLGDNLFHAPGENELDDHLCGHGIFLYRDRDHGHGLDDHGDSLGHAPDDVNAGARVHICAHVRAHAQARVLDPFLYSG